MFPPFFEQSTIYYSDKLTKFPDLIYQAPSKPATAEKAQHEPHYP